jgi:hypothetical protein
MQRLIDRVRIRGREYRLLEDLGDGTVHLASSQGTSKFSDRRAAYQLIGKLYRRLAADFAEAQPGATITLPMADGTTKTVQVITMTNTDLTVVDVQSGEQMTLPRMSGKPTTTQPGQGGGGGNQSSAPGVTVQGPGYGTTMGKRLTLSKRHAEAGAPTMDAPAPARKLTRHEIVTEAETLIRNSIASGQPVGLQQLADFMAQQYGNPRDELYAGAKMAYDKVQWEGTDGEEGGPPSLAEIAEPATAAWGEDAPRTSIYPPTYTG